MVLQFTDVRNQSHIRCGLAPMEGVTCFATRLWFSLTSQPDFAMTPFLRVTKEYPWKRVSSMYAAEIFELKNAVSYKLIPQLMGTSPDDLERIATPLLSGAPFVDVNCGCPSPKVVGSRAGSGLLEDREVFAAFLEGLQQKLGHDKFSIKMRSGFLSESEFPALLDIASSIKMAQLTLHPRTRKDRYTGRANWDLIATASRECEFSVVGSGDIVDFNTLNTLKNFAPNVNTVIIGRGALRNPWIFEEIRSGKSVCISRNALLFSLATFALLHEFQAHNPLKLLELVKQGLFFTPCLTNENLWQALYSKLTTSFYGTEQPISHLCLDKPTFAKVKMIWHALRSGLGAQFMHPQLLRSRDFCEFEREFLNIAKDYNDLIPLKYHSEFDWIYSGEKRNEKQESE